MTRKAKSVQSQKLDSRIVKHFADSGLTPDHLRAMGIEFVPAKGDPRIGIPVPAARIPYSHDGPTGSRPHRDPDGRAGRHP